MLINSKKAEESSILNLAYSVCAAARTAPKACGIDHLETAILTGEDKDRTWAEKHFGTDLLLLMTWQKA